MGVLLYTNKPSKQAPFSPSSTMGPDLMRQRVKDAPEEFASEVQLFLGGDPEVSPAGGEAVVLPAAFIVVGEELGRSKRGHTDGRHRVDGGQKKGQGGQGCLGLEIRKTIWIMQMMLMRENGLLLGEWFGSIYYVNLPFQFRVELQPELDLPGVALHKQAR